MKIAKVVATLFLIIGIILAVGGSINYIVTLKNTDKRIYTTSHVVRIDERETSDPEHPIEYTTFVEFEAGGKNTISRLNTYRSSFKIGTSIDIYYFENDYQMVYEIKSQHFDIVFILVGLTIAILGAILTFKKKQTVS